MIDFSRSYFIWLTHENSYGRFDIESICKVYDDEDNRIDTIYGLYGVMACDVYGEPPLFYSPSFFYQAIFNKSHVKVLRSFSLHQEKDSIQRIDEKFSETKPHISYVKNEKTIPLNTLDEIQSNLNKNKPFVAQIRFNRAEYTFELLFTVKHINCSISNKMFQVETGPIALPKENYPNLIDSCYHAYVAFNNFDTVNFLFSETKKLKNGEKIRHFCEPKNLKAEINLWTY